MTRAPMTHFRCVAHGDSFNAAGARRGAYRSDIFVRKDCVQDIVNVVPADAVDHANRPLGRLSANQARVDAQRLIGNEALRPGRYPSAVFLLFLIIAGPHLSVEAMGSAVFFWLAKSMHCCRCHAVRERKQHYRYNGFHEDASFSHL